MNQALAEGRDAALLFRKWMVNSDAPLDPQAYVLTPESALTIARVMVSAPTPVAAGKAAALTAIRLLREAHGEVPWLDRIQKSVETIPSNEAEFIGEMMGQVDTTKFIAADYNL